MTPQQVYIIEESLESLLQEGLRRELLQQQQQKMQYSKNVQTNWFRHSFTQV